MCPHMIIARHSFSEVTYYCSYVRTYVQGAKMTEFALLANFIMVLLDVVGTAHRPTSDASVVRVK